MVVAYTGYLDHLSLKGLDTCTIRILSYYDIQLVQLRLVSQTIVKCTIER